MRLTSGAFGAMTAELRTIAEECCDGRLVLVTEGGYDLVGLETSLDAAIDALAGSPASDVRRLWSADDGSARRGRQSVEAAQSALAPHWKL
jgi:acetoin utilization deacetylase AcuC-like enzyme